MEVVVSKTSASGRTIRASASGPLVRCGATIYVSYASEQAFSAPAVLLVHQLSTIKVDGIDWLEPLLREERFEPGERLNAVRQAFRKEPPSIKLTPYKRPVCRRRCAVEIRPTTNVSSIATGKHRADAKLTPGEYRVSLRTDSGRTELFSQDLFVVDPGLSAMHALDSLCQPEFRAIKRHPAEFLIGESVEDVLDRRAGDLYRRARETVTVDFKNSLGGEKAFAVRDQLMAEIEAVFAHAEQFVFANGTIAVRVIPGMCGSAFRIDVIPGITKAEHVSEVDTIQDLALRRSPDIQLGHVSVDRSSSPKLSYTYPSSS